MTTDLTPQEVEASLWALHTVEAAFSHEPPSGTTLASLKRKLLDEARGPLRKAADIPGPCVVREGKGWSNHQQEGVR